MVTSRPGPGPLFVLDFLILAAAYLSLLSHAAGASPSYKLAVVVGSVLVGAAALRTFHRGMLALVERVTQRMHVIAIALAVVVPWLLLFALIAGRGLWWTQRPQALRFFAVYLLVTWSITLCAGASGARGRLESARRAVAVVALALGAIGVQGLAFGVTPFGCGLSALIAAIAAFAFSIATRGAVASNLKLFAAAAAALLALAVGEIAVRVLQIGQNVREVDSREIAREFYSMTPPGSAFVNQPKALDEFGPAFIEINSRGIRGPEIEDTKADWLLIGDSMIEARQLPWEQTIGARLREAVRARSLPIRVVSHGMRGWSPLLEWNWYLKVGRKFAPRTVFVFFFWNDLWTVGDEISTFRAALSPDGRPDHFDVLVESKWIWYKHVRLMRLTEDVWQRGGVAQLRRAFSTMAGRNLSSGSLDTAGAQRLARSVSDPPLTAAQREAVLTKQEHELDPGLQALARTNFWPSIRPWTLWTPRQRAAAGRTELELQRFAEDVASDGARFVLVFVPNPMQVGPQECSVGRLFDRVDNGIVLPPESGLQTWLHMIAERHGFELLDPSAAMRAHVQTQTASDVLYLRADCHWAAAGHQFMADYLVDWAPRMKESGQ